MSRVDCYKHLNECTPLKVVYPMEQLVKDVCNLNYGTHRLLSALIYELRERGVKSDTEYAIKYPGCIPDGSPLADGIEDLLNKGYFF